MVIPTERTGEPSFVIRSYPSAHRRREFTVEWIPLLSLNNNVRHVIKTISLPKMILPANDFPHPVKKPQIFYSMVNS